MTENILQRHEIATGFDETRSESVSQIVDHKAHAGVLANTIVGRLQLPDVTAGDAITWDTGIPYTLSSLLEKCGRYDMQVAPVADQPRPLPGDPVPSTYPTVGNLDDKTLIEFPFRLFLSPYSRAH